MSKKEAGDLGTYHSLTTAPDPTAVPHYLAGLANIAELFGKLQYLSVPSSRRPPVRRGGAELSGRLGDEVDQAAW